MDLDAEQEEAENVSDSKSESSDSEDSDADSVYFPMGSREAYEAPDQNKLQKLAAYHDMHLYKRIHRYWPRKPWDDEAGALAPEEARDVRRYRHLMNRLAALRAVVFKRYCWAGASKWWYSRVHRTRTGTDDWKAFKHYNQAADHDLIAGRIRQALERRGEAGAGAGASERAATERLNKRLAAHEILVEHHEQKGRLYLEIADARDHSLNPAGANDGSSFEARQAALVDYVGGPQYKKSREAKKQLAEMEADPLMDTLEADDGESSQNAPSLGSEGGESLPGEPRSC